MTPTARDLVEAGAIYMAACWHNPWETMEPEPKAMYLAASRAALIATFKKLAEDGPTEAMLEAWERIGVIDRYMARQLCVIGNQALLRELEGLTP